MHNHHSQLQDAIFERFNRERPPGTKPFPKFGPADADKAAYFRRWMDTDGEPWWPFWDNVRSLWSARHLPNVLTLHFNDLKRDLDREVARIAAFLEIPLDRSELERVVARCSFDSMKANAGRFAPRGGDTFTGGAGSFFEADSNGRWRDLLSPADVALYEATAERELGVECTCWLANGAAAS